MKKVIFGKKLFWCTVISALVVNILPLLIFSDKVRISTYSVPSILILVFVLIYGWLACVSKDGEEFLIKRHHRSRFWRYNRPTSDDVKEFWQSATIYFLPVPFYIPVICFSTTHLHFLWSLLLLLIPQFVFIGMGLSVLVGIVRAEKRRQEQLEKERLEQERREELGKWK